MAPEPAEPAKPLTAAQKKNQARAAARKAKKAAERAAAGAAGDDQSGSGGPDDAAKALDGLKISGADGGGGGGGGGAAGGAPSEPVDTAKKVCPLLYATPPTASGVCCGQPVLHLILLQRYRRNHALRCRGLRLSVYMAILKQGSQTLRISRFMCRVCS